MNIELSGEERRITLRLLSYWERKRAGRIMPREDDIDPADVADLWEYCFMIHPRDLEHDGVHFTFLGKAIEDMYRHGMPESEDREALFPRTSDLATGYHDVLSKKAPYIYEGELTNPHGDRLLYRQVLLPLGEDNNVQAVFGGLRFLKIVSYS